MVLPGAMSVYNMIVARTFFMANIPRELNEAAVMDGASDLQMLSKVALPLSKPILAVLTLFYAQGHWNAYFDGFMYLTNPKLLNFCHKTPLETSCLASIALHTQTLHKVTPSLCAHVTFKTLTSYLSLSSPDITCICKHSKI